MRLSGAHWSAALFHMFPPSYPSAHRVPYDCGTVQACTHGNTPDVAWASPAPSSRWTQALSVFWKQVQVLFRTEGALSEEAFFCGHWLHRAKAIRKFGEPLDIANWYFKNKHVTNAEDARPCHYINGLFVSEYIYASGLQAAVGRLGAALEQLLQQAELPRSDSMQEAEELKRAVEGAGLRGAVAAVGAGLEALNDARRSKAPGHAAALSKTEAGALERKEGEVLKAKLELLTACTGSLLEHATKVLALMSKVQSEAQTEPQAAVWGHAPAAPGQAVPGGAEGERGNCAAAGWSELAKWVGWRVEELRAAVAAVDEAVKGLEVAAAAQQQDVPLLVAAAEAAHARLAAAAGDTVERVGIRDNRCRPGRYQLIQRQEVRCSEEYGEPPTSLALARKLQWLGSGQAATRFQADTWPDCIASLLLRPGVSSPVAPQSAGHSARWSIYHATGPCMAEWGGVHPCRWTRYGAEAAANRQQRAVLTTINS
jgi:hypothetical protein